MKSGWQYDVAFVFFSLAWVFDAFTEHNPGGLALIGCLWVVIGLKESASKGRQ